jgi:AAA domain
MIIFGASKCGKSWLGSTTPAPRLILDAESGSRFVPGRKTRWDPKTQQPPQADDTWETCLVPVHDYATVQAALQWLISGSHPFNSVVLDSISEIQQRAVDSLVGTDQMRQQDWGALLRVVSDTVRKFRDLVSNPVHPLWAVVYLAMAMQRDGKWRPLVQGQLRDYLPYYADICGYLFANPPIDAAGTWPGNRLLVMSHPDFETGQRVGGVFGQIIDNPDISQMVRTVYDALNNQGRMQLWLTTRFVSVISSLPPKLQDFSSILAALTTRLSIPQRQRNRQQASQC